MSNAYLQKLKAEKNNLDLVRTNGTSEDVFYTTQSFNLKPRYGRWFMGRDVNGNNLIRERRAGLTPNVRELPGTALHDQLKDTGTFNRKFVYNSTANNYRSRGDGSVIIRP